MPLTITKNNKDQFIGKLFLTNNSFLPYTPHGEKWTYDEIPEAVPVLFTNIIYHPTHGLNHIEFIYNGNTYKSRHTDYTPISPGTNKLHNQNFVITGKLKYNRPVYQTLVVMHGGNVKPSVNKNTHFLLLGDLPIDKHTAKLNAAHQHNVTIINENTLYHMLGI